MNLLKVPGYCVNLGIEIPINVKFQIWDSTETTLIASGDTGDIYATEIAGAGNAFAYAIYEHSKLPLRVFEAARLITAMINGCQICMAWQSNYCSISSDYYIRWDQYRSCNDVVEILER